MRQEREMADNVWKFVEESAAFVGRLHCARFSDDMVMGCLERCESPIEDLFYVAVCAQCQAESVEVNPGPEYDDKGQLTIGDGIVIRPQVQIGSFRVDFVVSQVGLGPEKFGRPIVVELDGHAFHDKDKKQRAYEKARDRFLVKEGYRVLHFTGSEVTADPHKVAFEVLDMLALYLGSYRTYDPKNPLGIEE